jgi:AcrR family transcriptional regulator
VPRPARFDDGAILDAALRVVIAAGPAGVTTDAVAREMGGHVGSIYYRFPTKDHLLAQLWLHCARAGHAGVLTALANDDVEVALEQAVLHYPRWSRIDAAPARVLAAYGREHIATTWPPELADELATINDDLIAAVNAFSQRWWGDTDRTHRQAATFAVLDMPAAAIRRYLLAGKPPPTSLDAPLLAAAQAALRPKPLDGRGSPPLAEQAL